MIVGIYVLRRVLDLVAERTGLRILGLVVVLIEAFFMLLLIMSGIRVFQTFRLWLRDRAVMQWLTEVRDALGRFFAIFKIDLPEILSKVWGLFSEQIWPVLIDVVAQPLFWLAVAALVFGSRSSPWSTIAFPPPAEPESAPEIASGGADLASVGVRS